VGNLKVVAHVFAVGKPPSVKDIVGIVSNPRVGGTLAPVAKIMTSCKVAWASLPENKQTKLRSLGNVLIPSREMTVFLESICFTIAFGLMQVPKEMSGRNKCTESD